MLRVQKLLILIAVFCCAVTSFSQNDTSFKIVDGVDSWNSRGL